MRKLSKVKSRMLSFILSLCMVMVGVIIAAVPQKVEAAVIEDFINGEYYYIKNVRSGKYLTVQHNEFNVGQNIVQWSYTGQSNQKWQFELTNGYYRIRACDTSLVISITSESSTIGLQAKLATKNSSDNKQLFWATNMLDNGSYRFQTKASSCSRVLLANGASLYNNTYIVQGNTTTQWNDQWLVELASNKSANMSIKYAGKNYNHRLATYPDFDYYINSENKIYESTNFASQCLAAGGFNYYKSGTSSNWWYVNKKEHSSPNQNYNFNGLTTNWDVKLKWYKPSDLKQYLTGQLHKTYQICTDTDCFLPGHSYNGELNGITCKKGDIIFIINDSNNKIVDVVVAAENASDIFIIAMNVYSHSPNSSYNYETMNYVLNYGTGYNCSNCRLEIVKMY